MAEVRFDGAYGLCGVCVASTLNKCIETATCTLRKNVALNGFRFPTIIKYPDRILSFSGYSFPFF